MKFFGPHRPERVLLRRNTLYVCSRVKTVISVPSEECVISSHSHRAPSARGRPRLAGLKKNTGQLVNSTVRLSSDRPPVP